jgi:hypothetical protein
MTLAEYVEREGRGALSRLVERSGLSYPTVMKAAHGEPVGLYATAKAISEATGGEVSIESLCEPDEGEAA